MRPNLDQPETWPGFKPMIIAHDVGRSRDRSTAVVGGGSPFQSSVIGLEEFWELPQNLYGSARASALAQVDRRHNSNALIVADLSNDESYGEDLFEVFGPRVIGLHICRHGDGMSFERRLVRHSAMLVYRIGRTQLIQNFQRLMESHRVRITAGPESQKAYGQLGDLQTEMREGGDTVYSTLPGHHDDLGISCCMVAWAALHPHQPSWLNRAFASRMPRPRSRPISSAGWT